MHMRELCQSTARRLERRLLRKGYERSVVMHRGSRDRIYWKRGAARGFTFAPTYDGMGTVVAFAWSTYR